MTQYFWPLFRWAVFTLVLALLQLWVAILFRYLIFATIDLRAILAGGGLFFYSNAVVMQVVRDKWADWSQPTVNRIHTQADFLYQFAVPAVVLLVTVVAYLAILQGPRDLSRLIGMQFVITPLAVLHSLTYHVSKLRSGGVQ